MLAVMEKCFLKIYHKFGFIETIRRCLLRALSMPWCPFTRTYTSKKPILSTTAEAGVKEVFFVEKRGQVWYNIPDKLKLGELK